MRSYSVSKVMAMSVVAIAMLGLGIEPVVIGGVTEPPTGTEQITGPAIDGVFTVSPNQSGYYDLAFAGRCGSGNKSSVHYFNNQIQFTVPLAQVTASSLENIRLDDATIMTTCFSGATGRLIITNVTKFANDGILAGGDASVSVVQAKK